MKINPRTRSCNFFSERPRSPPFSACSSPSGLRSKFFSNQVSCICAFGSSSNQLHIQPGRSRSTKSSIQPLHSPAPTSCRCHSHGGTGSQSRERRSPCRYSSSSSSRPSPLQSRSESPSTNLRLVDAQIDHSSSPGANPPTPERFKAESMSGPLQ